MATNQNNIHINSFSKGMNTDTSLDMVGNEQYVFGQNIRITANALLRGAIDSNSKEGIVTPVQSGQLGHGSFVDNAFDADGNPQYSILAIATLGDIGAIIIKDIRYGVEFGVWHIYRIDYNKNTDSLSFTKIFSSAKSIPVEPSEDADPDEEPVYVLNENGETTDKNKFSVVINKETEQLVKLYIADGVHEMMAINIHSSEDAYNLSLVPNDLRNNKFFPKYKVCISDKIAGTLTTGQVQYTYRFYNKNGVCSKLAPLTNKIQVIDNGRNKEVGNAEETQTTVGFQLTIHHDAEAIKIFDHLQIYRLEYTKPSSDAKVLLIYDAKVGGGGDIKINDNGLDSVQELSIQEFAALDTIDITPDCIEQNQNYMFAANIKDETRLRFGKREDNDQSEMQFDAKAYQFDDNQVIRLYSNRDTTYQDDPHEYGSVSEITDGDEYTLNKYSDMTIDFQQNPISHPCKYDEQGYLGGTGKNVSWRFVTTDVPLDVTTEDHGEAPPMFDRDIVSQISYIKPGTNGLEVEATNNTTNNYFQQHGIELQPNLSYNDLFTSSLLRSLRRDEVYRYGIVLYDRYGRRSDTQWIGDIRTPSEEEFPSTVSTATPLAPAITYTFDGSYCSYSESISDLNDWWCHASIDCNFISPIYSKSPSSTYTVELDPSTTCFGSVVVSTVKNISSMDQNEYVGSFSFGENGVNPITIEDFSTKIRDAAQQSPQVDTSVAGIDFGLNATRFTLTSHFNADESTVQANVTKINLDIQLVPTSSLKSYEYISLAQFAIYPVFKVTVTNSRSSQDPTQDVFYARPLGIEFKVKDLPSDISRYQIVRCAKTASYTKNLMQCATARPVRQPVVTSATVGRALTERYTPYYPNPMLTSDYLQDYYLWPSDGDDVDADNFMPFTASNEDNTELFQIFSPEIQVLQDDSLAKLQSFVTKVIPLYHSYSESLSTTNKRLSCDTVNTYYTDDDLVTVRSILDVVTMRNATGSNPHAFYFKRQNTKGTDYDEDPNRPEWIPEHFDSEERPILSSTYSYPKEDLSFIFKNYKRSAVRPTVPRDIEDVKNVSNPNWEEGFSNIKLNGTKITSGVMQYKSFTTSINKHEYVNWVCNGMYDLHISQSIYTNCRRYKPDTKEQGFCVMMEPDVKGDYRAADAKGWIGPGPRCFLISIKNSRMDFPNEIEYTPDDGVYPATVWEDYKAFMSRLMDISEHYISSCVVNIQHTPSQYAGLTNEEKQYDVYYGFGNTASKDDSLMVFDGDVYVTPCEITSMYKTYDFNSYDTIPSAQLIYYVPLESTINTYFDYGMGYRNTGSKTVLLEPGEIGGVRTQARPEHQYNTIYSDNNVSNDIYNVQSLEDSTQRFPQRIHYSTLKTNGELIDNWQMFKALDYIDVDTRYGQITNLLTSKDTIYFWQNQAFGRLSVNERSLVTDNNSNTVQLGQGGVLQRSDYINTRYGMRPEDYSAISAEGSIYWIDIINKAVLMSDGQHVLNLGENLNVQNCINNLIVEDVPTIHYDLQNNELLCKCLEGGKQIVFNIKLNMATAVYDRKYEDSIVFNNVLFGVLGDEIRKYNYIQGEPEYSGITSRLEFVVNNAASTTKVFDDQEIVTLARGDYKDETNAKDNYFTDKYFTFTTNIVNETQKNPTGYTDREGNVRYPIPRYDEKAYGNRMRGKWLKVDIEDQKPKYEHSISHILTKFRQSFS